MIDQIRVVLIVVDIVAYQMLIVRWRRYAGKNF